MISNRDRMGSVSSTFPANDNDGLYRPPRLTDKKQKKTVNLMNGEIPMGLAAAITEQRACNVVTIPALLIEIVCCSIAS